MQHVHKHFGDAHKCMVLSSAFLSPETSCDFYTEGRHATEWSSDIQKIKLEKSPEYVKMPHKIPSTCARYAPRLPHSSHFPKAAGPRSTDAQSIPLQAPVLSWVVLFFRNQVIKSKVNWCHKGWICSLTAGAHIGVTTKSISGPLCSWPKQRFWSQGCGYDCVTQYFSDM